MAHEQIGFLRPEDLNCNIFSVYDYDGLSIQELLCQFFHKINECIEVSDRTADLADWLVSEGLKEEVVKKLMEWKENGTLANIIDNEILGNLKGRTKALEQCFPTIKQYGAKGDGVTDDTAAIQKALDDCNVQGIYELYVPAGKYKITSSLTTREVKLTGLSEPYAPNPIGFEYAHPQNKNTSKHLRSKWLNKCGGSIFTCEENIDVFKDGLYAENIMIFGAVDKPQQHGIGQQYGGPGQQIKLKNVSILCCGHDAISAKYGLISLRMKGCRINYNMGHAMYVGRTKGGVNPTIGQEYTGESNDWIIEECNFDRNETDGLELDLMGRSFVIRNNSFEHQGYHSDMNTDTNGNIEKVCYGCRISLTRAEGGFNAGNVDFVGNYSESSQGLLYITTQASYANYINIEKNLWRPYNVAIMNSGIRLKGRMFNVKIWNNDVYTPNNWILFMDGADIKGLVTNTEISYSGAHLDKNLSWESRLGVNSNPLNNFFTHDKIQIGKTIPNLALQASYQAATDTTLIKYPNSAINNQTAFDGYVNDHPDNPAVGNLLVLDGRPSGYITAISTAHNAITVAGNFQDAVHGNTMSVAFYETGGFYTTNGLGKQVKLVVNNSNKVVAIIKER